MKINRIFTAMLLFTLLFLTSVSLPFFAQAVTEQDYSDLFQQVKCAGEDLTEVSPALSEAFHSNPIAFINALGQEDMSMWTTVDNVIVTCNTGKGNDLEFLQFILEVFASDDFIHPGRDAFLPILMGFHADVSGADTEFVNVLFNAMRYSDGISSDKLGIYIYELFLDDPVWIVHQIMEQDEAFQEHMVTTLNYQCYTAKAQYSAILNDLSKSQGLSETEKVFVAKLIEKFTLTGNAESTQPATEAEIIDPMPTDALNATEPVATKPGSNSQNILPFALAAILLIGYGAFVILKKKKSQNNA